MASTRHFLLFCLVVVVASGYTLKSGDDHSCQGRCGERYDRHNPCSCDDRCMYYHHCCHDYDAKCGGHTDVVTDQDLIEFSQKLFAMPRDKSLSSVNVNFQAKTSNCGPDNSYGRLYSVGDEAGIFAIDTIAKLLPLLDNYIPDVLKPEHVTDQEKQEEQEFMDAVMQTPEMQEAYQFLKKHSVFTSSIKDFSAHVHKIWFGLYDRDGTRNNVLDSSGFEHVFVGEIKRNEVSGQHNWVAQYLQEKNNKVNYRGYLDHATYVSDKSVNAHAVTSVYDWMGYHKCIGGSLIGTTPELELALATVCFKVRSEKDCKLSFGSGHFSYKTFPMSYRGYNYIGTAYPE